MLNGVAAPTPRFSSLHIPPSSASSSCPLRGRRPSVSRRAVERDLDWEPEVAKGPLVAPRFRPPPPPPPRRTAPNWLQSPFSSRRNIVLSVLFGTGSLYAINHQLRFEDRPDIDFNLAGYTDLSPDDFVYFKTPGGNWVAAARDERDRLFMIDQIGDLYYDSGDPNIGIYAMDTAGNLFNFYQDTDGERKITPVGNISELKKFKISAITGIKLDQDVSMVAFEDGRKIPLPPQAGYYTKAGRFVPPGELIEGFTQRATDRDNPFAQNANRSYRPERLEVDPADSRSYKRQLFDQTLLDDPDLEGFQAALPDDFDINKLAQQVEEAAKRKQ